MPWFELLNGVGVIAAVSPDIQFPAHVQGRPHNVSCSASLTCTLSCHGLPFVHG